MNKKNKYYRIYLILEKRILNETYKAGDFLPSENLLVQQFNVSRETIRKALALLLENGYIQKLQGKGSMIIDRERYSFPISGLISFKELQVSQNMKAKTIVLKNEYQLLSEEIKRYIHAKNDILGWQIERIRYLNGEASILDKDFLLDAKIGRIDETVLEDSLYDYLEKKCGYEISYAQKEITVEKAKAEDFATLDLHSDKHVVVVRSSVFLKDTTLFQYTESRHRLDRFRFTDFARRR